MGNVPFYNPFRSVDELIQKERGTMPAFPTMSYHYLESRDSNLQLDMAFDLDRPKLSSSLMSKL